MAAEDLAGVAIAQPADLTTAPLMTRNKASGILELAQCYPNVSLVGQGVNDR